MKFDGAGENRGGGGEVVAEKRRKWGSGEAYNEISKEVGEGGRVKALKLKRDGEVEGTRRGVQRRRT